MTLGSLIHELGHLLGTSVTLDNSDEESFLGWEWRTAKLLGIERQWWRKSMAHYGTDTNASFGDLTLKEKKDYIRRVIRIGKANGSVSPTGRPIAQWGPRKGI